MMNNDNTHEKADEQGALLLAAAASGGVQTVQNLIKQGVDPNTTDEQGNTPLYLAARHNRLAVMTFLITLKDVRIDQCNKYDYTPLYAAAYYGYIEAVRILIKKGADVKCCIERAHDCIKDHSGAGPSPHQAVLNPLLIITGAAYIVEDLLQFSEEDWEYIKVIEISREESEQCSSFSKLNSRLRDLERIEAVKSDPNLSRFKKFCHVFANCKNLRALNVNLKFLLGSRGSFTDEHSQVLCAALVECKKLKKLRLSSLAYHTPCEVQHFIALCNAIATLDQLEVLHLSDNDLNNLNMDCIAAFKNALSQLPNLTSLNLEKNCLGKLNEPCFLALCEAASSCNLSSINLQDNYLYNLNDEFLKVLLEKLLTAPNLCKIFIRSAAQMSMGTEDVFNTFFHMLKGHPSLIEIGGIPFTTEQEKKWKELCEKKKQYVRELRSVVSFASLPTALHEIVLLYMVHQDILIELEANAQESKQWCETEETKMSQEQNVGPVQASTLRGLHAKFESRVEESMVEHDAQEHAVLIWTSSSASSSSTDTAAQRRQRKHYRKNIKK